MLTVLVVNVVFLLVILVIGLLSLIGVGRMILAFLAAPTDPYLSKFCIAVVCLTLAIICYLDEPQLVATFHLPATNQTLLVFHAAQDLLIILSATFGALLAIAMHFRQGTIKSRQYQRNVWRVLAVILSGATIFWVIAFQQNNRESVARFIYDPAHSLPLVIYRFIVILTVLGGQIYIINFSRLIGKYSPYPFIKLSNLVTFAIFGFGIGSSVLSLLMAITPPTSRYASPLLTGTRLCILAITLGISLSTLLSVKFVQRRLQAIANHGWNMLAYRRLYPVWATLTALTPPNSIVLNTQIAWSVALRKPTLMQFLLRRRVQEIRDAERWLGWQAADPTTTQLFVTPDEAPTPANGFRQRIAEIQQDAEDTARLHALAQQEAAGIARAAQGEMLHLTLDHPTTYLNEIRYLLYVAHALHPFVPATPTPVLVKESV